MALRIPELTKWTTGKQNRIQSIRDRDYANGRAGLLNFWHDEKSKLKQAISRYSTDLYSRKTFAEWYQRLAIDRTVLMRLAANGQKDTEYYTKRVEGAKRVLSAIRATRLAFGTPKVFWNHDYPFWVDPNSKFIDSENLNKAQKLGMTFFTFHFFPKSPNGNASRIVRDEQRMHHLGIWTFDDTRADKEVFYFENASDMMRFKMKWHEYEYAKD